MKFAEINAKFSAIVSEWLAKGYVIHTPTMSGSQGEIAKVDLTDGTEIIRVLMTRFGEPCVWVEDREYNLEGVKLLVGNAGDNAGPVRLSFFTTIWNEHLDVLSCEEFYEVGCVNRNGEQWYGTKEEALAQQKIQQERENARRIPRCIVLPEAARKVVFPLIRQKLQGFQLSEITKVEKAFPGAMFYYVTARGAKHKIVFLKRDCF